MLLKCQINTNINRLDFCVLQNVTKGYWMLILSFNHLNFFIYVCQFYNNFVLIWHFTSISSNFTSISQSLSSISSHFTSITSFHLHWDNTPTAMTISKLSKEIAPLKYECLFFFPPIWQNHIWILNSLNQVLNKNSSLKMTVTSIRLSSKKNQCWNKESVAKEPVYWNDFTLWDTATRYSRCGQKSYSIIFSRSSP